MSYYASWAHNQQQNQAPRPWSGGAGPTMQPFNGGPPRSAGAGQGQSFPGFGYQAPNLSWLNPGQGAARPSVPNISVRTPSSSAPGMIQNYNRRYQEWLSQRGQNNQLNQGINLLMQDAAANNQSQELQFQQGQGLLNQTMGLVGQMDQRFVAPAEQAAGQIDALAGQVGQQAGQSVEAWQDLYNRNRSDLMGELNAANDMADAGVGSFQDARDEYQDMSAQTVSAMLGGMSQDIQSRMQQVQSGLGPDGNMMTPEQIQETQTAMRNQWAGQRYQVATQLLSQQNEVMSRLTQDIGQAQMSAAGVRSGNAGTQAQFDATGQGQFIEAHNQRLAAQNMSADMYALSNNIRSGGQMMSIDRQLQGMQFGAQLAREFPYSPTSMFDLFINMSQLQQSGAGRRQGFQFPRMA